MVHTDSDESKLRTFQGPSQDQISFCKDIYGGFHNADIANDILQVCNNFLHFRFGDTSRLIGICYIYILEEIMQSMNF